MKMQKKMSGGMPAGGGHKNYKMTGKVGQAKYGKMMKAKTGKLVGGQENLPDGLKESNLSIRMQWLHQELQVLISQSMRL
jgi:hypothetical protein